MATEFQQMLASAVITAAVHPTQYAKVLIQIGHEPLAPEPCKTLFGKQALCYPNVFKCIGHIKKCDGFLGLYRGLGASIGSNLAGSLVNHAVSKYLYPDGEQKKDLRIELGSEDMKDQVTMFCVQTGKDCLARCAGIVASHPLRVIMLRSMAQFVGGESQYNSVWSSVSEIYREDGILGFFSGLIPRLIGELVSIWISSLLVQGIVAIVGGDGKNNVAVTYSGAMCSLMVSQFTYPFHLISTIQAVNTTGLTAGRPPSMPQFSGWTDCWSYLRVKGDLKRGSSMFFRYYKGPVILVNGKPSPAASVF